MSRASVLIAAAVVAGGLYLVGAIALGSPPEVTDSGQSVVHWFRDHQDAARIYAWTASLGTLAFAIATGIVRSLLPSPHGHVFLIGAAAFVVENSIAAWIWAGIALHPGSLEPATARLVYDIASFWGPLLTGATTTMIAAVTVLSGIPRWLRVIGIVAFAEQAIETITVFGTHGFTRPGGPMNILLGAGLTAVWFVALVVWASGRLRLGEPAAA